MELTQAKRFFSGWSSRSVLRIVGLSALALLLFAVVLVIFGKDPLRAYKDIFLSTLGSSYGFSETLVKMIPLVLTAVAVAVPGRIWLINIGGEGQLHVGALFATWGALTFSNLPAWILLPFVSSLGFLGGGLWAMVSGILRARGWVSETISTLLLNYVAILLVNFAVYGPMIDPESVNYPQSAEFSAAATLPAFAGTRVHFGLIFALVVVVLYYFVLSRTRWGLEMKAIGGNTDAARICGLPISKYVIVLMFIGGGMAGLAGMCEVSAIQGRLRPSLSSGYGYTGFLISWMAMGHPIGILGAAFLLAVITAGGDILQMTQSIPAAVVNILMAIILFVVLARHGSRR